MESVKDLSCLWLSIQFFFSLSSSSTAHQPQLWKSNQMKEQDPIRLHTACFRSSPISVAAVQFKQSVSISPRLWPSADILPTSSTPKWATKPNNNNTRSSILRLLSFNHPVYYLLPAIASIWFRPPFLSTQGWNKLLQSMRKKLLIWLLCVIVRSSYFLQQKVLD